MTADSRKQVQEDILTLKLQKRFKTRKTLFNCIESYVDSRTNVLSSSTIRGYNSIKNNRFQDIMYRPIADIENWQAVVNKESKLVSPKTLKNSWGLVHSVLLDNGVDCGKIHIPMVIPPKKEFLQPEQIKVFVEAIKNDHYELLYLLCLHGLRRSEVLALEKSDVTDSIYINKSRVTGADHKFVTKPTTKNASSTRTVPVFIDRLKELVESAPEGRLVKCDPHWVNKHLAKICEKNNLPVVSLHGLRHSFASLCYHLNVSELQCMEFGGWSDLTTMRKIYTHIADEDRKKATAALRAFGAV